jgi:hypothetical protein
MLSDAMVSMEVHNMAASRSSALKHLNIAFDIACLVAVLYGVGCTHLVLDSQHAPRLIQKVHFSVSETIVSMDAITGMSRVMAEFKYPLAMQALLRDHLIRYPSIAEGGAP